MGIDLLSLKESERVLYNALFFLWALLINKESSKRNEEELVKAQKVEALLGTTDFSLLLQQGPTSVTCAFITYTISTLGLCRPFAMFKATRSL